MDSTQRPLKILHLVKTSVGGTWALRQMRELVKLGAIVHAALPPGGPLIPAYESSGVVVHPVSLDLPVRAPWRWPSLFKMMQVLVAQVQPDIIHSHNVGTTLTMRLALGKKHPVPRIFQIPGPLHLEHRIFRQAEIATAVPGDYWIGSCALTCEIYRRSGIADDRIFLSYYGTDLDKFSDTPTGKLRAELGISENVKLVGLVAYMYAPKHYLGQTRGLKGHEDFIDALALCREHDPEIIGVIIGGAWQGADWYERHVREHGKARCGDGIRFLGARYDIPDLYPDLDVAVHPSYSENVGGAVESFLCAVPTIATNVGGLPDVVIPDETGWLVPPQSPPDLASAIIDALIDPVRSKRLARSGQILVQELFDVRRTANQIRGIYETILTARSQQAR
ncbi:MAG: glycosyltransferase family 4 protein [Anaerolineae bacterium]|nr:glycosyltransferase family 4 protein [Anaerolineae bacterium]